MSKPAVEFVELIRAVGLIAWPILSGAVAVAAVLLFLVDRRHHTVCMMIGSAMILLLHVTNVIAWFPGVGYFSQGDFSGEEVQKFISWFTAFNLLAWSLFAYGLLALATIRYRVSKNPDLARDRDRFA